MDQRFDYFVIFAEMRTGSNLLEATLSQIDGIRCHGEVFNPDHLGGPKQKEVMGMTMADRLADPAELLERIRRAEGFNGFRFFFDHEPRVLDTILSDPRCAKVVLTRNPVDCYISLKIAYNTKRWQLTDVKDKIAWKPPFKPEEFAAFLAERQAFQLRLLNALQVTGQTAFYLDYEDSLKVDVINGLLRFLGQEGEVDRIADSLIRQNPEEMSQKVRNYPQMEAALAEIDWADLSRSPNFEPRRGPGIPRAIAAAHAPILFFPLRPSSDAVVRGWLDGFGKGGIVEGFTQKTLKAWKRKSPGHRSFSVIRHPLARAYEAFRLVGASDHYAEIRPVLRDHYAVPFPAEVAEQPAGAGQVAEAFMAFLGFVKANLAGQTGVRQDAGWASQLSLLQGIAGFAPPDLILREDRLERDLSSLAASLDLPPPAVPAAPDDSGVPLARIYSADIEKAARDAYMRDYMSFGFSDWSAAAG